HEEDPASRRYGAHKLAEAIRNKQLSPVELMEATLKRIGEINPKLNAYLIVTEEEAMRAAREAEKGLHTGAKPGPLHGIPVSIKDLVLTKGIRTTQGSLVYKDFIPDKEGTMVQRLKAAGAIIIGKTNTPEFGLSCCTENKLTDTCRNPWNTERNSGGSSGGAAAGTAAGISPLAQGSDGGGSTRIPASWCGVFGLKASYGRVPKDVQPWGVSHVSCLDPMTRNVRDTALMLNVMAGPDGLDYSCIRTAPPDFLKAVDGKLGKLRIAWSPDLRYGVKVDPEVKSAVEAAARVFAGMGHEVEEAAPDTGEPFDLWDVLLAAQYDLYLDFALDKHADELMDYTRLALECARGLGGVEVARTWTQIERVRGIMRDFFEKYDLLLTPTTAVTAPPVGKRGRGRGRGFIDWDFIPFTSVFNLTGNPAASVPCGFSAGGLPVGLQIIGRFGDEVTVLQASAAFEEAQPWADKYPAVS
ncbi:MAG: amidase, partial [Dehalococcoidia bacterium]|nr:amidase [Dehalococcoidia bacterium]